MRNCTKWIDMEMEILLLKRIYFGANCGKWSFHRWLPKVSTRETKMNFPRSSCCSSFRTATAAAVAATAVRIHNMPSFALCSIIWITNFKLSRAPKDPEMTNSKPKNEHLNSLITYFNLTKNFFFRLFTSLITLLFVAFTNSLDIKISIPTGGTQQYCRWASDRWKCLFISPALCTYIIWMVEKYKIQDETTSYLFAGRTISSIASNQKNKIK